MKIVEMIGKKFGMLTVIERDLTVNMPHKHYVCACDCGTIKTIRGTVLSRGDIKSCGCYRAERGKEMFTKHGNYNHPLYHTWAHIMRRCYNADGEDKALYQDKGIIVCERWHEFENFVTDMGARPDNHSIDRINSNGNYEPGNCRWATAITQANNRKSNSFVTFKGEKMTMANFARTIGICAQKARYLIKMKGMTTDEVSNLVPVT